MNLNISKRAVIIATSLLLLVLVLRLASGNALQIKDKLLTIATSDSAPSKPAYGKITNKVAVITDTEWTPRLVPLILHFHAVLGPEWPIVFYTSEETKKEHFESEKGSAIWRRAVEDGRIQVRIIPPEFDMTSREDVNLYLSRPWLWESLAPAQHVLVFQADSMICANSHRSIDEFLEWDWIAATLHTTIHYYNGGLSLRNRTMMLDILYEGNNWEAETKSGEWDMGGEDVWFSAKMDQRGAHLPDPKQAAKFACQYEWHLNMEKEPFGYHKVHKNAPNRIDEIAQWCPEIALAAAGHLQG